MLRFGILLLFIFSTPSEAKNCKNVLKDLLALYPEQNKTMMVARIENAKNKHMFMRAFIPYYYKHAYKMRKTLPVYDKLKNHVGQIVGDAHVGNFGFMVDNKGKSLLTLNDFDDVAEAPLFLDVMRLSQSASYVGDFKQSKLLDAYKKGLSGSDYGYSDYIKSLKAKSEKGSITTKADIEVTTRGPRFASKTEPAKALTKNQSTEIQNILKEKYGKETKIHDSYKTMKESGGSAFGTRYHTLMEVDGKMHFVEFKEIMDGGVVSQWLKKPVTNEERILNARRTFLGNNFNEKLDVVKIGDRSFQIRFKAKGNKSIDVKAVKDTHVEDVIADEFYTLGQLHRQSLAASGTKVSDYLKDFNSVTREEWEESVKIMKKEMKKAYNKGQELK